MSEERMKILEDRLMRLEATLAQRPAGTVGSTPPGGMIVDPAPWGGGGSGWGFHPRPYPSPIVDPAPWPWGGGWGPRWPPFVSDPAPWPPTTVSDPAPFPGNAFTQPTSATTFGRFGHIVDPVPPDFSRLSLSQLESTLHTINAEKARLDSMESMIKKQIETINKKQPG